MFPRRPPPPPALYPPWVVPLTEVFVPWEFETLDLSSLQACVPSLLHGQLHDLKTSMWIHKHVGHAQPGAVVRITHNFIVRFAPRTA